MLENERLNLRMLPMESVIAMHKGHFFEPSAMAFFKSKLPSCAYKIDESSYFFITSEKGPEMKRAYTIRKMNENGDITTVGDFQAYKSEKSALKGINKLVSDSIRLGAIKP